MKVLAVLITTGVVNPLCLQALEAQNYPLVGTVISQASPQALSPNPDDNKYLNCSANRNLARDLALRHSADAFLFMDDDVVMPPGAVRHLASHRKPVVGGWYKIKFSDRWVAGRWVADNVFLNYRCPQPSVVQTDMVGLGCALITREVLEKVSFEPGLDRICRTPTGETMVLGECLAFGNRVTDLGYTLHMDGSVLCEHLLQNPPSSP